MTVLEAHKAVVAFRRYRDLSMQYWAAVKPTPRSGYTAIDIGTPPYVETDESYTLRERILKLEPETQHWAQRIGMSVTGENYPPTMVGGPVVSVNFLTKVTNQWTGYQHVNPEQIIDVLDRCIGAAEFTRRRLFYRLLKPWCWLVDIPALIVGWPFAIMRKAGVPNSMIESTGAQVFKAISTIALWIAAFGYAVYKSGWWPAIKDTLKLP